MMGQGEQFGTIWKELIQCPSFVLSSDFPDFIITLTCLRTTLITFQMQYLYL